MTEGLRPVVQLAFGALDLHRLEAGIQPDSTSSLNLVERLDFQREGYSAAFQYINGEWRDHERWAITAEMIRTAAHWPAGEKEGTLNLTDIP